jgi:hypothetical protein
MTESAKMVTEPPVTESEALLEEFSILELEDRLEFSACCNCGCGKDANCDCGCPADPD